MNRETLAKAKMLEKSISHYKKKYETLHDAFNDLKASNVDDLSGKLTYFVNVLMNKITGMDVLEDIVHSVLLSYDECLGNAEAELENL